MPSYRRSGFQGRLGALRGQFGGDQAVKTSGRSCSPYLWDCTEVSSRRLCSASRRVELRRLFQGRAAIARPRSGARAYMPLPSSSPSSSLLLYY